MDGNLYNQIIRYNDIQSIVPSRYDQLCVGNPDTLIVDRSISSNHNILFHPNCVKDYHAYEDGGMVYYMQMFGPLLNGQKTCVMIRINPYFDIELDSTYDKDKLSKSIIDTLECKYNGIVKYEHIRGNTYMGGYHQHKTTFLRIHMRSNIERVKAIIYCRTQLGYKVYSVDGGSQAYYRVIAATYQIKMGIWLNISQYVSCMKHRNIKLNNTMIVKIDHVSVYTGDILTQKSLRLDKTVVLTWDIETTKSIERTDAEPPMPEDIDSYIFQISINANTVHENTPYLNILLTLFPVLPDKDKLIVLCDNEESLLRAFADIWDKIDPDAECGYNTGAYDWMWVKERAVKYNIIQYYADKLSNVAHTKRKKDTIDDHIRNIIQYNYINHRVKLNPDTSMNVRVFTFPGYVSYDLMPTFRKTHMKQCETAGLYGLNFFLAMYNLPLKHDMSISTMFSTCAEMEQYGGRHNEIPTVLLETMSKIGRYCSNDTASTFMLTRIDSGNSISDLREMANMSYTSLSDAIWYAGGMKVRNLIISYGTAYKYIFNTYAEYTSTREKYIGGYVHPPIKGAVVPKLSFAERRVHVDHIDDFKDITDNDMRDLHEYVLDPTGKTLPTQSKYIFDKFEDDTQHNPVIILDFASLYPSIIIAYNIDPTSAVYDARTARKLINKGYDLYHSKFMHKGVQREIWFRRHDGSFEDMAIGPQILLGLFKDRVQLKSDMAQLKPISMLIRDNMMDEYINNPNDDKFTQYKLDVSAVKKYIGYTCDDIEYVRKYLDSKQRARKVFMNTFYGVMGEPSSPFFNLDIAATITSTGQNLIKKARDVTLDDHGCKIYYGDTDSIFISCADSAFAELGKQYYSANMSKLDYCTHVTNLTIEMSSDITDDINAKMIEYVDNDYIKIVCECIVYPAAFIRKKSYFGITHTSSARFDVKSIDDVYMKGLSIVKRGTSPIQCKLTSEVVLEIVNIYNTISIKDIIYNKVVDAFSRTWDICDFIKSATYKPPRPGKPGNVAIIKFVTRMKATGGHVPLPSDRIKYVITKVYPWTYDLRGRQSEASIGDKIMYPDDVKLGDIDMEYYMTNQVSGQFAQILSYCSEFHVDPVDDSNDALKCADTASKDLAKSWINSICATHTPKHINRGPIMKKIYSRISKNIKTASLDKLSKIDIKLLKSNIGDDLNNVYNNILEDIKTSSKKTAPANAEKYVNGILKVKGADYIYTLKILYGSGAKSIYRKTRSYLNMRYADGTNKLANNLPRYVEIYKSRNVAISDAVSIAYNALDINKYIYLTDSPAIPNPITDDRCVVVDKRMDQYMMPVDDIKEFTYNYTVLKSISDKIHTNESILEHINYVIGSDTKAPPTINVVDEINAINKFTRDMMGDVSYYE